MAASSKERVRRFWEDHPCGAQDVQEVPGSPGFFAALERWRYGGDPFMPRLVGFHRAAGQRLLEVGCGPGTDLVSFATAGAQVVGVDLTHRAAVLARSNLQSHGHRGWVLVGDGERLPFQDDSFDFVYSWGVIHHVPQPAVAAREIVRVCRPGGRVLVMLYNRRSLVALQTWLVYGLLRGRPLRTPKSLIYEHVESPGTQAFTRREAMQLFGGLEIVRVESVVTRWDLRFGRRRFLPAWLAKALPRGLGWFMVLEGRKPRRV